MIVPLPVGSVLGYVSFAIACIVLYWYWRDRRLLRASMARYGPPLQAFLDSARDPKYLAEVVAQVVCYGKVDAEGKPITAPADVLYGMLAALEPQAIEHLKQAAPALMRAYFEAQSGYDPNDASQAARTLMARRGGKWAKAAAGARAAAKVAPMDGIVGTLLEALQHAPEIAEGIKALKEMGGSAPAQAGQAAKVYAGEVPR